MREGIGKRERNSRLDACSDIDGVHAQGERCREELCKKRDYDGRGERERLMGTRWTIAPASGRPRSGLGCMRPLMIDCTWILDRTNRSRVLTDQDGCPGKTKLLRAKVRWDWIFAEMSEKLKSPLPSASVSGSSKAALDDFTPPHLACVESDSSAVSEKKQDSDSARPVPSQAVGPGLTGDEA